MKYITGQQLKALRLLDINTRGSFDVYRLAGDAASSDRQNIMQTLTGNKMPKAKCGVTAMREQFMQLARDHGANDALENASCFAARDDVFADWARNQIAKDAESLTA